MTAADAHTRRHARAASALALAAVLVLAAIASMARAGVSVPPLADLSRLAVPLVLALGAAAAAGALAQGLGDGTEDRRGPRCGRAAAILPLAAIGAAAVAMRWYRLADMPYGLWFDTAQAGNVAIRILRDPSYRPVFVPDLTQLPALSLYLAAASIRLLGATPFALRAVGAVAGTLTVVATWGAGRALFGPRVGVVAAALAAGSGWLLAIDRIAIGSALVPTSMVGAVWCVAAGASRPRDAEGARGDPGRRWAARCAAAAAITAAGLYSYWGAYVAPPIVGLLILAESARVAGAGPRGARAARFWARALLGGTAYVATLLIALAPLASYALAHPRQFTQRAATINAVDGTAGTAGITIGESALRHVAMFWVWGDRNGRHNLAGAPELDPLTGALVLAGAAALLAARGTRSRGAWLLAWIGLGLVAGIASTPSEAPNAHRTVAVVPAVLLLAAVGADRLARAAALAMATTRLGHRSASARAAAALGAVCAIAFGLGAWRFLAQQASPATQAAYSPTETLFARDVDTLPISTAVYVGRGIDRQHPTVRFLSPRAAAATELGGATYIPQGRPVAFYLSPSDASTLDALRALMPGSSLAPIRLPGGPELLERIVAAGPQVAARTAATASFGGRVALVGATVRTDDRQPGVYWAALDLRAERDAPGYFSASLRAIDAAGDVWGQQDGLGDADLSAWTSGQRGLVLVRLGLYGGTPPGRLTLDLRLYDLASKAVLPVGENGSESLELGRVSVTGLVPTGQDAPEPPLEKLDLPLGDSVRLLGVHIGSTEVPRGSTERVDLLWRCLRRAGRPVIALTSPEGDVVGELGSAGGLAAPALDRCEPGSTYLERLSLPIGARWPAGAYRLVASAPGGENQAGIVDLGAVRV